MAIQRNKPLYIKKYTKIGKTFYARVLTVPEIIKKAKKFKIYDSSCDKEVHTLEDSFTSEMNNQCNKLLKFEVCGWQNDIHYEIINSDSYSYYDWMLDFCTKDNIKAMKVLYSEKAN